MQIDEVEDCKSDSTVVCPVCGTNVRGGGAGINNHLDLCLKRGVKRKLTQQTLLQLKFGSNVVSQCSFEGNSLLKFEEENVASCLIVVEGDSASCHDEAPVVAKNTAICEFGATDCTFSGQCIDSSYTESESECGKESSTLLNNKGLEFDIATKSEGVSGFIINDPEDLQIRSENQRGDHTAFKVEEAADSESRITRSNEMLSARTTSSSGRSDLSERGVTILDTVFHSYVVGRKFSDEKVINDGMAISLSRDPDNPKDPNAVEVLSADATCPRKLGFLPRKLAQHLSPMIEKFNAVFEGFVTSVNTNKFDAVPIQLCCRKVMLDEMGLHDIEVLTSLWKNVLHVVKSEKNNPPTGIKYQANFVLMLQEVLRRNDHLFTLDEKELLESYASLSDDSQRLFIRLYTRKGPWFRIAKVSYPEVADIQQAVKLLNESGYMHSIEDVDQLTKVDANKILNLLSISQLREIATMFKQNSTSCTRKQDLIAYISSFYDDGLCISTLPSLILKHAGTCIQISSTARALVRRVERLFFLNEDQDLTTFLLADLGRIKYPAYQGTAVNPIFSCRRDLLQYEEAVELELQMEDSLEQSHIESISKCINAAESWISNTSFGHSSATNSKPCNTFLICYSPSWYYAKILFLGANYMERMHRYKEAINMLKLLISKFLYHSKRGCWMLRLSVDLEHTDCLDESLSVAEEALKDPSVRSGAKMALQRRVLRLGKPPRRWKLPGFALSLRRKIKEVHIQGRPLNCVTGVKNRFYGGNGDQCGVEQLALEFYAGEGGGWDGVHTESGIWLTVFGLLMWDIIFSDVPDVFHNRFQTAPLDFGTDHFYIARKGAIEAHLQRIQDGMAEEILVESWQKHLGTACRGVNWERHSISELRAAVVCTGGPCLASLCRHLAEDYKSWSSGMPDLFLWRFHGEYNGEAKLVEVKGPKDSLSEQQRAWLLLLRDCGFDTEVCKVSAIPKT